MRVTGEEKYRAQPNLRVFRIKLEDNEIAQIRLKSETNYHDFKREIERVLPFTFKNYKIIVDELNLLNKVIVVSIWRADESC